jgi:hypothetical protein
MLADDDHSVRRVQNRLVPLVPAHAIVLVLTLTEQLDDLAPPRWLSRQTLRLDPIAYLSTVLSAVRGHWGLLRFASRFAYAGI